LFHYQFPTIVTCGKNKCSDDANCLLVLFKVKIYEMTCSSFYPFLKLFFPFLSKNITQLTICLSPNMVLKLNVKLLGWHQTKLVGG
jgi:hypothetical protein